MEKLNIKNLNLIEFENNLTTMIDTERLSFIDSVVQTVFKSPNYKSYHDFLKAVHLNARNFYELYGMITIFIKRTKLRQSEIGEIIDDFTVKDTPVLDLNTDPEKSVFGAFEIPEDLPFVVEVIHSVFNALIKEKKLISLFDILQKIIDNPLPEISNWSIVSFVIMTSTDYDTENLSSSTKSEIEGESDESNEE